MPVDTIRQLNYLQRRAQELKEIFERDKGLDIMRKNELGKIERELVKIKGAVDGGDLEIKREMVQGMINALNSIEEINQVQSVREEKTAAKQQAKQESEEKIIITPLQKPAEIKPSQKSPESQQVQEMMRQFNISQEAAEEIIRDPEAAMKKIKQRYDELMNSQRKNEEVSTKKKKRLGNIRKK